MTQKLNVCCVLLLLASACTAESSEVADSSSEVPTEAEFEDALRTGETIKLYPESQGSVSSFCDRFTQLSVSTNPRVRGGYILQTENKVTGGCEVRVTPDRRRFAVVPKARTCGSEVFEGTQLYSGAPIEIGSSTNVVLSPTKIVFRDNRRRTCEDMFRKVEVEIGEGSARVSLATIL